MTPRERQNDLEFRAANKGYSASYIEAAKRQGLKLNELEGTMISISPNELKNLFDSIQELKDQLVEISEKQ